LVGRPYSHFLISQRLLPRQKTVDKLPGCLCVDRTPDSARQLVHEREEMRTRHSLILVAASVVSFSVPWSRLLAQTQSLGDVANKAAQQRPATEPSRVFTNADLKPGEGSASSNPDASPSDTSIISLAPSPLGPAPAREDIIRAVVPAVVAIETTGGTGTGFFVAPGLVLTNKHVIAGASSIRVRFSNGSTSSAYVSTTATDADLALVRVERPPAPQPTLTLGTTRSLQVGEEVLAIGSALGVLQSTVTRGIVSAVRSVGGLTFVQTDAAINPGNSGGPLVDKNGRVVGITTAKFISGESLGFAIAIDHATTLIQGQTSVARRDSGTPGRDTQLESALNPSAKSDTDLLRQRGLEQLEAAVRFLAQRADYIDSQWQRYQKGCSTRASLKIVDGRDWFGFWSRPVAASHESLANPAFVAKESLPECLQFRNELIGLMATIRSGMQQAEESARRAGVPPGDASVTRRKYSMDWSAWDR